MSGRTKLIVIAVLSTALTGCAGGGAEPGVATAAGGPSAGVASTAAATPDNAKLKECLAKNGVDIEDFEKGANPAPDLPEKLAKCREFLPDGGTLAPLSPDELAKVQKYAKCMRGNGVPDFPDPNAAGDFGPDWDGTKVVSTEAGEKANATCSKELLATGS